MASSIIKSVASKTPNISRLLMKNLLLPRFNHFSSQSSSSSQGEFSSSQGENPANLTPKHPNHITDPGMFRIITPSSTFAFSPNKQVKPFGYRESFVNPLVLTEDLVQLHPSKHDHDETTSIQKAGEEMEKILMEERILIKMKEVVQLHHDETIQKVGEEMEKMEERILIKMKEVEETVVYKVSEKLEVSMKENLKEEVAEVGQRVRKFFSALDPNDFVQEFNRRMEEEFHRRMEIEKSKGA